MNLKKISPYMLIAMAIMAAAFAYCCFYFNYFETPTGDFIGNFRPRIIEYMNGKFPGSNFKMLPVFPLLISLLAKLNPVDAHDTIYITALVLNIILFIPYLIIVFSIYSKFLKPRAALAALLFLCVNIYTAYTAVNSELEMLLSLLIVSSIYLTMRDSKLSYINAFFAAATKWDSVFTVPAVMFRDFFFNKKKIRALLLGTAAGSGVVLWFTLSIASSWGQPHPYVAEISHRGPNIYRYLIDCFLVASGFIQWMAAQAYHSENMAVKISLFAFIVLPALTVVAGIIRGGYLIVKNNLKEFAPILVFFGGFLLIHIIYQNTKSRYVLPILWLLVLFLFYGLSESIIPRTRKILERMSESTRKKAVIVLITFGAPLYIISLVMIFTAATPYHILFAIIFTFLAALVSHYETADKNMLNRTALVLIAGIIINFMVHYGSVTMDHYSLRRVEFKKAAEWYRDNATEKDRMLMTETNIAMYYTGFKAEKFMFPFFLKSTTIDELAAELKKEKVTHVFVDDFYIRRIAHGDKNAIDRKALLFKTVKDEGEKSGHFRLIKSFSTKGGINSYLYRLVQ